MPTPNIDLTIYEVLVTALKEYPGNARLGDVDAVAESLRVNGQYRPIVVRKETREILAGNHTWKAAQKLGWDTIKVTFVEGISDDDATRIVLADNRLNDVATYNIPDLTRLMESLPAIGDGGYQLEGTGFDNYVLVNMDAAFEKANEPTPLPSGSEDVLAPVKTITCPACHHTWEK